MAKSKDYATQLTRLANLNTNPARRDELLSTLSTIVMKHLDINQTLAPQKHRLEAVKKEIQHRFPLLFGRAGTCPDNKALEHAMGYVSVRFQWLRAKRQRRMNRANQKGEIQPRRARAPSPPESESAVTLKCLRDTPSSQDSHLGHRDLQETEDDPTLSQKMAVEPACQTLVFTPKARQTSVRTAFPRRPYATRASPSSWAPHGQCLVPTSGSCLRACCFDGMLLDDTSHSEVVAFLSSSHVKSLVRFADVFIALGCSTTGNLEEISTWSEEQFDYFLSTVNSLLPACEPCTAFERMALWALFENYFEGNN